MAEVHLEIPDRYVREVRDALNKIGVAPGDTDKTPVTAKEIFAEALAVYRWVVVQTSAGRAVVATEDYQTISAQVETARIPAIDPAGWQPKGETGAKGG